MPGPVLTQPEIDRLTIEAARATEAAATFTSQIAAQTARAAELAVADGAFKKFFDYYNDDIIGKYDSERKALNGNYIASPIVEADILNCANLIASRTTPTLPATDIIRVAEFDGTPLIVDANNETQNIANQLSIETALVSGDGIYSATLTNTTSITSGSTTLGVSDSATPLTAVIGSILIFKDGSTSAVIRVNSITPGVGGPPYTATYGISVLSTVVGTIAAATPIYDFNGFNNTERTNKVPSDAALQGVMNYYIAQLQLFINNRITNLNTQLAAIAANQDPDGIAQFATATSNANTSKTFLTNYLVTTDISNTGIGLLSTERGVRSPQITTRVGQITANYTGQTINYYNARYSVANDRANTSRGTLRLQKNAETVATTSAAYASTLTDQANSINNILP